MIRSSAARELSELVPIRSRNRAVLVVEADPEVQAHLASALSREGHRVVGTGSGDGALALVEQWSVDLALVSDVLPGLGGLEVARLLREVRPHATVLVMSEHVEPSMRAAARAVGANDCVRKPLDIASLAPWLEDPVSPPANLLACREAVAQ